MAPDEQGAFAAYEPAARGRLWRCFVRGADVDDLADVARLHAEREGLPLAQAHEDVARWLAGGEQELLVAEHLGHVHGYARSLHRDLTGTVVAELSGWWLGGVVVAPAARRRGLGLALTRDRLARLADRTDVVWCVVSAANRASLDLHERAGFVEVRRAEALAGVAFAAGEGVLLRCDLTSS